MRARWAHRRARRRPGDAAPRGPPSRRSRDAARRGEVRPTPRTRGLAPRHWLTGGRFDKNNWGRWPTAADLDGVTGDRPAVMRSRDGHSRWVNTAALRAANIGKDTVAPEGGAIFRDARGSPTGVL